MYNIRLIFMLWGLLFLSVGKAQSMLDEYIDSALRNNVVLQQKNVSVDRAGYSLAVARSMFLPNVEFQGSYTTAGGGRDIPLPLGDLLNGAYATLNQLTQSQMFPQLKNEKVTFLPSDFYDVKIHTTVPIYNAGLSYNKKIRQQAVALSGYEVDIYRRELIKDVKNGYFRYLEAKEIVDIYQSSLELAKEGKRVNERLLENGKGLPAYVLRAESEVENVKAKQVEAQQGVDNARRYFNFLLNRNQEAPILKGDSIRIDHVISGLLKENTTPTYREELKALDETTKLRENMIQLSKSENKPSFNGFLDLGSQAENWKFNSQSRYYMAGVQLGIPIFNGNRIRNKVKEAEMDLKNSELSKENTANQLQLNADVAKNNLMSIYRKYQSSLKQLEAAQSYHRLIDRGYREGVNTYIETVDARNQLTQALLASRINYYEVLIAASILERENASYPLP